MAKAPAVELWVVEMAVVAAGMADLGDVVYGIIALTVMAHEDRLMEMPHPSKLKWVPQVARVGIAEMEETAVPQSG